MKHSKKCLPILLLMLLPLILTSCGVLNVGLAVSLIQLSPKTVRDIECIDMPYETAEISVPEEVPSDSQGTDSDLRPAYNKGTSRKLEGDLVVAAFFIDDQRCHWAPEEITEFTAKSLLPALDYLREQADDYDIDLDFTVWRYSVAFSDGLEDLTVDTGTTSDTLRLAARNIFNYPSPNELLSSLSQKAGGCEILPLVFINRDGSSSYQPTIDYEFCAIYRYRPDAPETYNPTRIAATIARETLEMFGANYYNYQERTELTERKYPRDIMLMNHVYLGNLEISPVTAYLIGWTDEPPEVVLRPEWRKAQKVVRP